MDTKLIHSKQKNTKTIMTSINSSNIKVQKRDGRLEALDINKIHFVVEEAVLSHHCPSLNTML